MKMSQENRRSPDCRTGVERILAIVAAACGKKRVAAVVVPRGFATTLAGELWPSEEDSSSAPRWDEDGLTSTSDLEDRERYFEFVEKGGYVGRLGDVPLLVADDMVICVLDKRELKEVALRKGWDLTELD